MARRFFSLALAYLVAFTVASPVPRALKVARQQSCSVPLIGGEINYVDALATTLDNDVIHLPDSGATSTQAYNVDSDIYKIVIELSNTYAAIKPCTGISETDFQGILTRLQTLASALSGAMNDLTNKRGVFDSTGTTWTVYNDLKSLAGGMSGVGNLLLARAPPALLPQAQNVLNAINSTLNGAVNAFSA